MVCCSGFDCVVIENVGLRRVLEEREEIVWTWERVFLEGLVLVISTVGGSNRNDDLDCVGYVGLVSESGNCWRREAFLFDSTFREEGPKLDWQG